MYKEVAIMWKNKESYVQYGGVFGLSIIKRVTLQKIVARDFRYSPHITLLCILCVCCVCYTARWQIQWLLIL